MSNDNNEHSIRLGPRLQKVASFVRQGALLGDIGTDHAYLPVYLIQHNIVSRAVGVDIHQGPYESAKETVIACGYADRIDIRMGNGLIPLVKGETDTLTIAGMGGNTILEILESNPRVTGEITSLILQPQGAEARLRQELPDRGWKLKDECLVEEDNRVYTIIYLLKSEGLDREDIEEKVRELTVIFENEFENKKPEGAYPDRKIIRKMIWQFGPLILLKKDKLLDKTLNNLIMSQHKVIGEMSKTNRKEVRVKANYLEKEVEIMEVMRRWLSL